MSQLAVTKIECVESKENYARFKAEPLEKGFGVTIGNSLRRVLFNYLSGAAVTRVKIEGVRHEFTVIPNAKEDVMEFLLNVKALRLKALADRPGKLVLDVQGGGRVCAADIKPSVDFEIANPDLCLLTLDSDAKLYIEFDVEIGEGFRAAEVSDNLPPGTLPLDAIFTPIRKANYTIEPVLIGRESSRERLVLEIWTDGTISPGDALSQAATLLLGQLAPFAEYVKISQAKAEEQLIRLSIPDEKYNMPVEKLDLSVRTMNCLRRSGITSVGELISKRPRELLNLRNFGQKSFQEIQERLEVLGLSLAADEESKKAITEEEPAEESTEESTAPAPELEIKDKEE